MIVWVFAMPVAMLVMVLVLDKIESSVVAPIDRAVKVVRLVEELPPEHAERDVAVLLTPAFADVRSPSRHKASLAQPAER